MPWLGRHGEVRTAQRTSCPAGQRWFALHLHDVGRGAERTAGNTPHGDVLTPGPLIEVARLEATDKDRGGDRRRTPPERQQR